MKYILLVMTVVVLGAAYGDDAARRFPMDMDDLGLTPKQHQSVEAAMKEYQQAYRRYHAQSEKIQEELNRLFLSPSFDEDAFRATQMEMARVSADIRTKLFARLHRILTSEQKRRFIRHLEEWEIE